MKYQSLQEIGRIPGLEPFEKYLIYGSEQANQMMASVPLQIIAAQAGWNMDSMDYGLERLMEVAAAGEKPRFVYDEAECQDDPARRDVNLIRFPAKKRKEGSPYIIVISGGAYTSVCSLVESYPVAARFNDLGYDVFALTYRVGGIGLMPKPMDDLAAALRYIRQHASQLQVDADHYIVCGFSAGGNLTALWGTTNHGYAAYHLPKPKALFPIYAFVTSSLLKMDDQMTRQTMTMCYGAENPEAVARDYDLDTHLDVSYPPTYLCCNHDDPLVSDQNSILLRDRLQQVGVPVALELGETGGHGFGEGRGLHVDKWYERAIQFVENLK